MLLDGDAAGAEGDFAARTVRGEMDRGERKEERKEKGERGERKRGADRQKYGRRREDEKMEEWRRIYTHTTHTHTHTHRVQQYTQSTLHASYPHHNTPNPA